VVSLFVVLGVCLASFLASGSGPELVIAEGIVGFNTVTYVGEDGAIGHGQIASVVRVQRWRFPSGDKELPLTRGGGLGALVVLVDAKTNVLSGASVYSQFGKRSLVRGEFRMIELPEEIAEYWSEKYFAHDGRGSTMAIVVDDIEDIKPGFKARFTQDIQSFRWFYRRR